MQQSKKIKILNLYACLGGNRFKWDEIDNIEVTAVELDRNLAELYQKRFPNDRVIVADAHAYLLENFNQFEFIWSSPPCPTHSRARFGYSSSGKKNVPPVYPDLKLYEEIILLERYYNGLYVVENVIPYYEPLRKGIVRDRHIYWTNFNLPKKLSSRDISGIISSGKDELKKLCEVHEIDLSNYKGKQNKLKIARNLVDYEAGYTILKAALNKITNQQDIQTKLF